MRQTKRHVREMGVRVDPSGDCHRTALCARVITSCKPPSERSATPRRSDTHTLATGHIWETCCPPLQSGAGSGRPTVRLTMRAWMRGGPTGRGPAVKVDVAP